ncbi:MAG TPA: alpha-ketoglutarate-dependent dioxygenase AlkB [Polyangiales bacterium]|nr:alpha-ketoglutarate-dependent dioxygenase AlkB [Polyangiales bacterium]
MQLSLFGAGPAEIAGFTGMRRTALDDGSWLDYAPEFVRGHEVLFARLVALMQWKTERRVMYEREVDVPRLFACAPDDGPLDPLLAQVAQLLAPRYGAPGFERVGMAFYRDGRDSVAWHRDKMPRDRETVVCILSLGAPRKFMIRPHGGGASRTFTLGNGDLFVLGGWCQLRWEHCVPKLRYAAPRMSCMFRHVYE